MSRDVTIRRDRRRTGRIYCLLVPPILERIVKKPLAAVALAAASVAIPLATALPAGAATASLACGTKTAKISYHHELTGPPSYQKLTWFTVKNPCHQWLQIGFGHYASLASPLYLSVAPGAHIQWASKQAQLIALATGGVPPYWKGFVSKTTALQCPEPAGTAGKVVAYSSTSVQTIC